MFYVTFLYKKILSTYYFLLSGPGDICLQCSCPVWWWDSNGLCEIYYGSEPNNLYNSGITQFLVLPVMKTAVKGVLHLWDWERKSFFQINSHTPGAKSASKEYTSATAVFEITVWLILQSSILLFQCQLSLEPYWAAYEADLVKLHSSFDSYRHLFWSSVHSGILDPQF